VGTGTDFGAGTDSNVFCTLTGDGGRSSGEFALAHSLQNLNKFERGQSDTFEHVCVSLGRIQEVTIRTDNAGLGCDWLLDHVTVTVYSQVFATRNLKHHPVIFEYGKWLNEHNTIVVLKPSKQAREKQLGASLGIIKKLASMGGLH
jgi:hypothetical protein